MLRRPLDRFPGVELVLVLQSPTGEITGAVHRGCLLDAAQTEALQRAHAWQPSGGK
jgi:hypothetical protein